MESFKLKEQEQDYEAYVKLYEERLEAMKRARSSATDQGKIIHSDVPLNFTFMDIQNVQQLKKERPRAGKRKPIEIEEDETDTKNERHVAVKEEADENENITVGVVVTRAQNNPQINTMLSNHYISLQQQKNVHGGRKIEDGKVEEKRKKQIEYHVDSLLLNNNKIRSIVGLYDTMKLVLTHSIPEKLLWINLSFNYLTKIEMEILSFPNLKTLLLHGNFISEMEEVKKL